MRDDPWLHIYNTATVVIWSKPHLHNVYRCNYIEIIVLYVPPNVERIYSTTATLKWPCATARRTSYLAQALYTTHSYREHQAHSHSQRRLSFSSAIIWWLHQQKSIVCCLHGYVCIVVCIWVRNKVGAIAFVCGVVVQQRQRRNDVSYCIYTGRDYYFEHCTHLSLTPCTHKYTPHRYNGFTM